MINIRINRVNTKGIKGNELEVIFFGDWHIGSKECNIEVIQKEIDYITANKNKVRVILMGDLMNMALKDSVGAGPWDDEIEPQAQYDLIVKMLQPIKDVVIGVHVGNHELRLFNTASLNMCKNLARELDCTYLEAGALHHIRFGTQTYLIYTTHGTSGATTPQGRLSACMKLQNIADADIYAMGHMHDLIAYSQDYMKASLKDKTLITRKKYFVVTGHYLNYGGYAEQKNYAPGKMGAGRVTLSADKWNVEIKL